MLKLDRMTDYAAVVLAELRREGGPATAGALAAATGLSCHTVARVLKLLARGGFVSSSRGRSGGYSPAMRDVSLLDLVEEIEGRIAISPCVPGGVAYCAAMGRCPSEGQWEAVNLQIRAALAAHSVDSLVNWKGNCACSC